MSLMWELPWHYAGTIVCLTQGQRIQGKTLFEKLSKCTDIELADKCRHDQNGSASDGFIEFITSHWRLKKVYSGQRSWPYNLRLKFRRNTPAPSLDHRALVIPWPLQGDLNPNNDNRISSRLNKYHNNDKWVPEFRTAGTDPDLDPSIGLYLNEFMLSSDDAVGYHNLSARRKFKREAKGKGCDKEKGWIKKRATDPPSAGGHAYTGPPYPESLTACVDDDLIPQQTQWEAYDADADTPAHLHLRLGWDASFMGLLSRLPAPLRRLLQDDVREYDRWPCGSFSE